MRRPSSLRNLGKASDRALAEIGILTAEQLLAEDPVQVFVRLEMAGRQTSLTMLWALVGAVEDRHWLDLGTDEKRSLLGWLEGERFA